jgi:hypothetical protein
LLQHRVARFCALYGVHFDIERGMRGAIQIEELGTPTSFIAGFAGLRRDTTSDKAEQGESSKSE